MVNQKANHSWYLTFVQASLWSQTTSLMAIWVSDSLLRTPAGWRGMFGIFTQLQTAFITILPGCTVVFSLTRSTSGGIGDPMWTMLKRIISFRVGFLCTNSTNYHERCKLIVACPNIIIDINDYLKQTYVHVRTKWIPSFLIRLLIKILN